MISLYLLITFALVLRFNLTDTFLNGTNFTGDAF